MDKRIYLCLAHMSGREMAYIQEAFDTNWVVPLGPNVNAFEEELEKFLAIDNGQLTMDNLGDAPNNSQLSILNCPLKRVVALSAGTAAIHLGLIQLGVRPGDEVICQSFTFCASANPVTYLGATPVFVDSEEDTWNMSPVLLEEAIRDRMAKTGRKPKAIIPVHLYGMPAKMDGKKWPPTHPRCWQSGVATSFSAPVSSNVAAPMLVHVPMISVDCSSPANSTSGKNVPASPMSAPHKSAESTG